MDSRSGGKLMDAIMLKKLGGSAVREVTITNASEISTAAQLVNTLFPNGTTNKVCFATYKSFANETPIYNQIGDFTIDLRTTMTFGMRYRGGWGNIYNLSSAYDCNCTNGDIYYCLEIEV